MKNNVKTFRLFVRPDEKSRQIANTIRELNKNSAKPLIESNSPDLVIAIGGDGTFIDAVTSTNFCKEIIYTGIHTGTLGFLQDLCENDIFSLIQYINFEQELKTKKVYIAFIEVFLDNGEIKSFYALNEVIIAGKSYSTICFKEFVNNEFIQTVTGNGIIIATSTGDTAYSMNANGAIDLSNNCQLVSTLLTPIKNASYERFITNPIICSKINTVIKPAENISIIIDGIEKDVDSSSIKKIEVSMVDSNYINKLNIIDNSKASIIRKKILGY